MQLNQRQSGVGDNEGGSRGRKGASVHCLWLRRIGMVTIGGQLQIRSTLNVSWNPWQRIATGNHTGYLETALGGITLPTMSSTNVMNDLQFQPQKWVFLVTPATSARPPVPSAPSTARRGMLRHYNRPRNYGPAGSPSGDDCRAFRLPGCSPPQAKTHEERF